MQSLEPARAWLSSMLSAGPSLHGTFELAGTALAATLFAMRAERRDRLTDRLMVVLLGALICGALAARLSTLGRYLALEADPSAFDFLLRGGQSVLGGLAGAYLGVLLTKRLVGYRPGTGDLFAPAVALGMSLGRVGCLLTEPPGTPTSLPWGVVLPAERAALFPGLPPSWVGVPLHPSFAYEILFHLLAAAGLYRLERRQLFEGDRLKVYLLAYAFFRFAVEWVRGNPAVALGLTRSQWFLIPSSLLLVAYFVRRAHRPPLNSALPEPADA